MMSLTIYGCGKRKVYHQPTHRSGNACSSRVNADYNRCTMKTRHIKERCLRDAQSQKSFDFHCYSDERQRLEICESESDARFMDECGGDIRITK